VTPEGYSKLAVKEVFERHRHDLWWYMPVSGGYGQHGIPDYIVCCCGLFLAVECKAEKGKLSALQIMQLTRITDAAGVALVVWGTDVMELEAWITRVIHEHASPTN
jgi:hypothetical protein